MSVSLEDIDLSANIGGFHFPTCVMNASGARCTSAKEIEILMNNPGTGGVVAKSTTLEFRTGNPQPRYYHDHNENHPYPLFSINSTGLANHGYQYYIPGYETYADRHKPYMMSVAGLCADDNLTILNAIENECQKKDLRVLTELNLSCPNVIGKPQTGYDMEATDRLLSRVFQRHESRMSIGLKLPPYFDFVHYEQMASVISKYPVSFLTCINSVGNTLVVDFVTEKPMIRPKGGFGGLGGVCIKPIALANVRKFHQLLPDIPIIGCGGVHSGMDVFEHILAGATLVEIGSQLMIEGTECFQRVLSELRLLMQLKGYKKLSDFRGNLKDHQ